MTGRLHDRCGVCDVVWDPLPHDPEPPADFTTRADALTRLDRAPVRGVRLPPWVDDWPDPEDVS